MRHVEPTTSPGDRRWQGLVSRARQAPVETAPPLPVGFADRVLDGVPLRNVQVRSQGAERVVGLAAGLALAASLLVAAWSWGDIEAVLAAGPASLEQIVQLEPRP